MLQQGSLAMLVRNLRANDLRWVEVETNGTIPLLNALSPLIDQINCSPKLANSGNAERLRYAPIVLQQYQKTGKAIFKFVVQDAADEEEISSIVKRNDLSNIYLMPLGTTVDDIQARMPLVAKLAKKHGWNVTTRLHILTYGNKRKT